MGIGFTAVCSVCVVNNRWNVLDNAILTVDVGLDLAVRVDYSTSLDEQRATISLRERRSP